MEPIEIIQGQGKITILVDIETLREKYRDILSLAIKNEQERERIVQLLVPDPKQSARPHINTAEEYMLEEKKVRKERGIKE